MTNLPRWDAAYHRFIQTYNGKALLKKHDLAEVGIWLVRPEECDQGDGRRIYGQPDVGTYEGVLEDIIRYVARKPEFSNNAGVGTISKVTEKAQHKLALPVYNADEAEKKELIRIRDELYQMLVDLDTRIAKL
jgi:hypothetical protein